VRVLRRSKTGLLASGAGLAVRVIFVLYSFETGHADSMAFGTIWSRPGRCQEHRHKPTNPKARQPRHWGETPVASENRYLRVMYTTKGRNTAT
jgi:hypothetical protein